MVELLQAAAQRRLMFLTVPLRRFLLMTALQFLQSRMFLIHHLTLRPRHTLRTLLLQPHHLLPLRLLPALARKYAWTKDFNLSVDALQWPLTLFG